jgi:hypothetical protein
MFLIAGAIVLGSRPAVVMAISLYPAIVLEISPHKQG